MQRVVPNLWFDSEAEEAANFYISVFGDGKILATTRYGKSGAEVAGRPEGSVLTVEFEVLGQRMIALNGGPVFKFNEAVSLMVECASQEELDRYWNALSAVPEAEQCGWLKDKYGLSWQIVPDGMSEMMTGESEKAERAMAAVFTMKKLDIAALQAAYEGTA